MVAHPMTEQATRQMALMEWKTLCKRDTGRKHARKLFHVSRIRLRQREKKNIILTM